MTVQRIDEMTEPPVIGRCYLVPTVDYVYCGISGIWPTIGPLHSDAPIIGFAPLHYHVDLRFLSRRQADRLIAKRLSVLNPSLDQVAAQYPLSQRPPPGPVVYRRRRCARQAVYPTSLTTANTAWPPKLRAHYADARLIDTPHGPVCPHKGAPLGSIQPDARGLIVCPLHGLCFDPATGKAVANPPRTP